MFAGTRSIGKAFEARGHEVYSVEWNKNFENIDLYADISQVTAQDILEKFGHPDVIWASPDCTTFSIAAISHHRRKNPETGNLDPISDYAKFCDATDQHVVSLIKELNPTYYFIENPRGGMRKMTWMQDLPRYTITYCKYGDTRMKPTDIWTNHPKPKFHLTFASSLISYDSKYSVYLRFLHNKQTLYLDYHNFLPYQKLLLCIFLRLSYLWIIS